MVVSGYVTCYGRSIESAGGLWRILKRRTLAYMLPWAVWSIVMKYFMMMERGGFPFLLQHMDYGLWFLSTLWIICVMFSIARYVAAVCTVRKNGLAETAIQLGTVALQAALLGAVAMVYGVSFLGIKYVLYYSLFYGLGFLWGKYHGAIAAWRHFAAAKQAVAFVCIIAYLFIVYNVNLYAGDDLPTVLLRVIASVGGCIVVADFVSQWKDCAVTRWLAFIGTISLEFYILHFYMLNIIPVDGLELHSFQGVVSVIINYALTIMFTLAAIYVFHRNRWCKLLLFGRSN